MDDDLGFFDRTSTRELIRRLGTPLDWTIYVGLGGTIDRTGMAWDSLVVNLLSQFEPDNATRRLIVEKHGPVNTSTMIETMIYSEYSTNHLARMRSLIAQSLYGNQRFMAGRILRSLASFAIANAAAGGSVVFVTPNYDMYLHEELEKFAARLEVEELLLPLIVADRSTPRKEYMKAVENGKIGCVHIHGYVHEDEAQSQGEPVLGEFTYHRTARRTQRVLKDMFSNRHLLIMGSSLTDGPLVNALLEGNIPDNDTPSGATLTPTVNRVAIMPLQSNEWRSSDRVELDRLIGWNKTRLAALNVEVAHPDFYGQVGQLFTELGGAIEASDAPHMSDHHWHRRYTERLEGWWNDWRSWATAEGCSPSEEFLAHEDLATLLSQIRVIIGAPPDEGLKLELWCRWDPRPRSRVLKLWAASNSSWPDLATKHADAIRLGAKYRAVEVFCSGAPRFLYADDTGSAEHQKSRWRTYFGWPIWLDEAGGQLPVGVMMISSLREADDPLVTQQSSLQARNLHRISVAMNAGTDLAVTLLGREKPSREPEQLSS